MIKVNASYLHLLDRFRSEDDSMEAIACFNIRKPWEGEGVCIEALNGHMYGVMHDPDGVLEGAENVLLRPSPAMLKAFKPSKVQVGSKKVPSSPVLVLETKLYEGDSSLRKGEVQCVGARVEHAVGQELPGIVLYVEPNPGECIKNFQYPNTEGFVAKRQDCLRGDVARISDMAFHAKQLGLYDFGDPSKLCVFFHPSGNAEHPVFVTVNSHPNFLGIIMPMMIDSCAGAEDPLLNLDRSFLPKLRPLPTPAELVETALNQNHAVLAM